MRTLEQLSIETKRFATASKPCDPSKYWRPKITEREEMARKEEVKKGTIPF